MTPEGRQIFLDNLKGQSRKMKHFAEKSIASLGATEVSAKARTEAVEQSKVICEDYIYNRLATTLHFQQERYLEEMISFTYERQNSTTSDTTNDPSDNVSESPDNSTASTADADGSRSFVGRSIGRLFSRYPVASTNDVFIQSSPDKVGLVRFEKWRNELSDASYEILELGQKLENAYPLLYDNLSTQLKMPLRSEAAVTRALTCIGDSMFENSFVTWYRVVALFAVAGALALELVDNRRGDLIGPLVQVFAQVIDRHVAHWVCKQGGWIAIMPDYQPVDEKYQKMLKFLGFIVGFAAFMFFIPISYFTFYFSFV